MEIIESCVKPQACSTILLNPQLKLGNSDEILKIRNVRNNVLPKDNINVYISKNNKTIKFECEKKSTRWTLGMLLFAAHDFSVNFMRWYCATEKLDYEKEVKKITINKLNISAMNIYVYL